VGWDHVIVVACRYGGDGLGIDSWWGRDFPHPSRLTLGPTTLPVQGVTCLFAKGRAVGTVTCLFAEGRAVGTVRCLFAEGRAVGTVTCLFAKGRAVGTVTCVFAEGRAVEKWR
jgi:hypothetical protein